MVGSCPDRFKKITYEMVKIFCKFNKWIDTKCEPMKKYPLVNGLVQNSYIRADTKTQLIFFLKRFKDMKLFENHYLITMGIGDLVNYHMFKMLKEFCEYHMRELLPVNGKNLMVRVHS